MGLENRTHNWIWIILIAIIGLATLSMPAKATDFHQSYDVVKAGETEFTYGAWPIKFDNTHYGNVKNITIDIHQSSGTSFAQVSRSTTFFISSGGNGSGTFSYQQLNAYPGEPYGQIKWVFDNNTVITGNWIFLTYADNLFPDMFVTLGCDVDASCPPTQNQAVRAVGYRSPQNWSIPGNYFVTVSNYSNPTLTSWSNSKTNNNTLNLNVGASDTINFNATANQVINSWNWYKDTILVSNNYNNYTTAFAVGTHNISVNGTNTLNGTSNTITWNINSFSNLTNYDPSGYVKDASGNPIQGAKVVVSNATYTDACILTSCYSDSTGHWGGTIYADGTYNFNVSKQGFTTLTGSQAFTVGGINNNFTLTASKATLSGHVYTTLAGTGTTAIQGSLQNLRVDSCGIATGGGTLTIGTSGDGSSYVLKLIDVDSGNQQSIWQLLKDGSVLYNNQIVNTGTPLQLKIYETFYENVYVDIRVSNVFQGSSGELNTANTCGSFEHVSKSPSLLDWLIKIASDFALAFTFTGPSGATVLAFYDVMQATDGTNTNFVYFNSTAGKDAIGYADFTVNNPATIYNFNMALTAESATANAGKIEIGYTDDTQTQDNGFTDVIYINTKQSCQANGNGYCTPQHDFKSVDVDGDGKIRVWFKFATGYSNFKLYEFYLNAWGTTTQIPLSGAAVYSMNYSNSTTLTDAFGAYTLIMPLASTTVAYTKIGYESKNFNLVFNNSYPSQTKDVILNSTNATVNTTKEYLTVPNFVQGTPTNGNFKTLGHTSLLGGYQIAICPQLGGDCKTQNVPSNTESTFALDPNLPIGTYQADLTGYLGGLLDIGRDVIFSTNFTVTSSTAHVDWSNGADGYFLGDTMVLSIYVPSSTADVNVTYLTNGSAIYSNTFSATGTVQNVSFVTNRNISLTQYQPGTYKGCITGGNCVTTTLYNISNSDYSLSAPATVNDGETFNILWKAPHTALLQIVDQKNNIRFSQDVPVGNSLTGQIPVDTTIFTHNVTTITTTLTRNGAVVATAITNITISPGAPSGVNNNLVGASSSIMNLPWIGLMLLIVVIFGLVKNGVEGGNFVFAVAITTSIEAVIGLWQQWGIYITVLSWLLVAVFFRLNKTVEV